MKNWKFQGQMSSYKYVNIGGESVTLKWKRCIQKRSISYRSTACVYIYIFKYKYISIYIYTCETVCKTNSISSMHSNLTFLFLLVVLMSFDCRIMYFSWCKLEPDPKWSKIDWVRHHFPRIPALVMQFFRIEQVFSVPNLHRHPLQWSKHSHSGEAGYNFWRLTTSQGQRQAWWSQPNCQVPRNTCRHWGHFFGWACHLIHGFSWRKKHMIFLGPKCGSRVGTWRRPRTRL